MILRKKVKGVIALLLVCSMLLVETVAWADPVSGDVNQADTNLTTSDKEINDPDVAVSNGDETPGNQSEILDSEPDIPAGDEPVVIDNEPDDPASNPEDLEEEPEAVEVTAEFVDDTETEIKITVSNYEAGDGSVVKFAAWSDANGQDDICWNILEADADGDYVYKQKVSDFKDPGKILIHVYAFDEAFNATFVGNTDITVSQFSGGKVEVDSVSREKGTATIKVSEISAPSGISKVQIPIWSMSDQSDIVWYTAEKKSDGWYLDFDIKNHNNNRAKYTCHVYATDKNGFLGFVGVTSLDFSMGENTIEAVVDEKAGTLDVSMLASDIPGSFMRIQFAVWTSDGGQDDLSWQIFENGKTASTWQKQVPLSSFKHAGKGVVHVYIANENYSMQYVGSTAFTIPSPTAESVEAVVEDMDQGEFSVKITGVTPESVSKVQVPVWSSNGGQDDIVWYTAEKDKNGDYVVSGTIADHKHDIGIYQAHVYVTDNNGLCSFVGNDTFEFTCDVGEVTVTEKVAETTYEAAIKVNAYPAGLSKVEFAVWSTANGQDDIVWYDSVKSGSTYTAKIDINNHKTLGDYNIHVYGTNLSGQRVFLGASSDLQINSTASGNVSVASTDDTTGKFTVNISDLISTAGISGVKLAAWSKADQSDIIWYDCNKKDDNTYVIDVNVANHQYNVGNYMFHAYLTMGNGVQYFVGAASYTFNPKDFIYVASSARGKRTLGIKNPSSTGDIRFAVWSNTNGQDDIIWYTAKQVDGNTWTAEMSTTNHKNAGTYTMHVYSYTNMSILGVTTFEVSQDEMLKNGWYYETINGRTYKLYYKNDVLQTDVRSIIGSVGSYQIEVNRTRCTVTVYAQDGANGYIIPVVAFACSVGLPSTPTPTGTYYTLDKQRWGLLMGPSYGQYCTRIVGGILFHSVAGSNMTSYNLSAGSYNMLGSPASHGCVRLCVRDAKWIYDNCALRTKVTIYDSSYAGPLGKPATIKIPASQNWDPTDPNV